MPNTLICKDLATIRWVVLGPSKAANTAPTPEPGYRAAGRRLFYVTARGRCWLVRDAQGHVQLTPAALAHDSCAVDEPAHIEICVVAEAADLLEQRQPAGIYHDAATFFFYYLAERGDVWMLYGTARRFVRVACLPPQATSVDLPPQEITTAILRVEAVG